MKHFDLTRHVSRQMFSRLPAIKHHLKITFYPPTKANRDIDNCLASIKAGLDGIADGLAINDKFFRPITIDFGETDKNNPRVVIEILA